MTREQPTSLRILFLSAEVFPYAKTGGLADVAGSLPKAIHRLGHDIRVIMPRYGFIDPGRWQLREIVSDLPVPFGDRVERARVYGTEHNGVPVYMVDNPRFFDRENIYAYPDDAERFIFFSRSALELARHFNWRPHIVHCNDWHTALVPNWLRTVYQKQTFWQATRTVYTIHNLAYQGVFDARVLYVAGLADQGLIVHPELPHWRDVVHFMARGIIFADMITTVSPRYAQEILTPEFGAGLDPLLQDRAENLVGILNGIDVDVWNPATDPFISRTYDVTRLAQRHANKRALQQKAELPVEDTVPLMGFIGRLTEQKGVDILIQVAEDVARHLGGQVVILGTGEEKWHRLIQETVTRYPRHIRAFLTFNNPMAHAIYAGVDMLLMPSRFEPCGLNQMIAMRYGAVPVVRAVGGLADTVHDFDPRQGTGNGFTFVPYEKTAFLTAVVRAVEHWKCDNTWRALQQRGMQTDFSWARSARAYVDVYHRALQTPGEIPPHLREKLSYMPLEEGA